MRCGSEGPPTYSAERCEPQQSIARYTSPLTYLSDAARTPRAASITDNFTTGLRFASNSSCRKLRRKCVREADGTKRRTVCHQPANRLIHPCFKCFTNCRTCTRYLCSTHKYFTRGICFAPTKLISSTYTSPHTLAASHKCMRRHPSVNKKRQLFLKYSPMEFETGPMLPCMPALSPTRSPKQTSGFRI
jgi:hypothetical protein